MELENTHACLRIHIHKLYIRPVAWVIFGSATRRDATRRDHGCFDVFLKALHYMRRQRY